MTTHPTSEPRTAEQRQIEADAAYWNELAARLGWRLHGFTFREHANFDTGHPYLAGLSGHERDDILAAIEAEAAPPPAEAVEALLDVKRLRAAMTVVAEMDPSEWLELGDDASAITVAYNAALPTTPQRSSPRSGTRMTDRILLYSDGTVDEIVRGDVHLEKMDREWAYLGAGNAQFSIRATKRGRLVVEPYQGTNLSQFSVERHKEPTDD